MPSPAAAALGILVAALCAGSALSAAAYARRAGVVTTGIPEIGASVMVLGKFDWQLDPGSKPGQPWSRCLDQIWRAVERSGSSQVNMIVTHHWLPPAFSSGIQAGVGSFCTMSGTDGVNTCLPWTPQLLAEFRTAMTVCFAEAFRQGLTVSIRPHLDDASSDHLWRNGLVFDPTQEYAGYSYNDIMLLPLADALRDALITTQINRLPGERPTVYFSLQGEMGATIMKYARVWGSLIPPLKARLGTTCVPLFGIGINFTGLRNAASQASVPISAFVQSLFQPGGFTEPSPEEKAGVKWLVETHLGFIGVSAYAPLTGPGFALTELESAAFNVKDDLSMMDIDIKGLIDAGAMELHYSEFGIGGASRSNGQPAAAATEVAEFPFSGINGIYKTAMDPWLLPWNKAFLTEFYSKVAAWLATPKTHRVSKVFVWCMASFDILGIYPESTSAEGSYRSLEVEALIKRHNAAARGIPFVPPRNAANVAAAAAAAAAAAVPAAVAPPLSSPNFVSPFGVPLNAARRPAPGAAAVMRTRAAAATAAAAAAADADNDSPMYLANRVGNLRLPGSGGFRLPRIG